MSQLQNKYLNQFETLKKNQYKIGNTNYKTRIKKLKALKIALEKTYKKQLQEAMYNDFKKHHLEVDISEIYTVLTEIKYAIKHLKNWMKKQRVKKPLVLFGSTSWIQHQPKGICLIISPWNYPINLTFAPLVSAIAAGNTVIIKPSEITSHTSAVMNTIIESIFNDDEIKMIQGDVDTSTELLKLPFNHIFFTGSPKVGKIVMQAAAKNLSSVTLELGGKSPAIIDKSAKINTAAKHIAWGKTLNNGQTCIAPDYALIHETVKDEFIESLKKWFIKYYTKQVKNSSDYCRIVNKNHFNRIKKLIDDATQKGAKIAYGGHTDEKDNFIEPTIISDLPNNALILNEEIFGPALPILTYKNINEVTTYINAKKIPLALYIFSKRKKNINYIIENTSAGTTCINTNMTHFGNPNLPFGGTNNSGFGKSHGYFGFEAFSNKRPVLKQNYKALSELLYPPFNTFKEKIMNFTLKWL